MIALFLMSLAFAGECKLPASPRVVTVPSSDEVTINDQRFYVARPDERAAFFSTLTECGYIEAAYKFEKWRRTRGTWSYVAAIVAVNAKHAMIRAIEEGR